MKLVTVANEALQMERMERTKNVIMRICSSNGWLDLSEVTEVEFCNAVSIGVDNELSSGLAIDAE